MDDIIFKPIKLNYIRYILIYSVMAGPVAACLGKLTAEISNPRPRPFDLLSWVAAAVGEIVAVLLGSCFLFLWLNEKSLSHLTICITHGHVSGPTSWFRRRESLQIIKIDKKRTTQKNIFEKAFGLRTLWSLDGRKIILYEMVYGKKQLDTCFEILELNKIS